MNESNFCAIWGNRLLPQSELKISVMDQGVVHGIAITEMLRTYRGELFEWERHWERFQQSADRVEIPIPCPGIRSLIDQMLVKNRELISQDSDLGLILSATPGLNPTYVGPGQQEPTFYAHTFEIPGELWAQATTKGQHLAISSVAHPSALTTPPLVKSRSRLHWYLADKDVAKRYPGSRAILLDQQGFVRETSTANLLVVRFGEILHPPDSTVLNGVSLAVTRELAVKNGFKVQEREMTADDLLQAEEIMTTSTPYGILGVSRLNSAAAGLQFPGPITTKLVEAWSELVGCNIHQQLRTIADIRQQTSQ